MLKFSIKPRFLIKSAKPLARISLSVSALNFVWIIITRPFIRRYLTHFHQVDVSILAN